VRCCWSYGFCIAKTPYSIYTSILVLAIFCRASIVLTAPLLMLHFAGTEDLQTFYPSVYATLSGTKALVEGLLVHVVEFPPAKCAHHDSPPCASPILSFKSFNILLSVSAQNQFFSHLTMKQCFKLLCEFDGNL